MIPSLMLAGAPVAALSWTPAASAADAIVAPSASYQSILDRMDSKDWAGAKDAINALDAADPMRAYLLANLYLAKDSPRVELFDVMDLLSKAPQLPQSEQLSRLATKRGAQILPDRPQVRQLMWTGGSPQRTILTPVKGDPLAQTLGPRLSAFVKANDPISAEGLIDSEGYGLSPACLTELRQRTAWSYFTNNDAANARRLALKAANEGEGPYKAPAWWVAGLASWRQHAWGDAASAFSNAAQHSDDADLRSAAYYWAARASMADQKPQKVAALLKAAAREEESFYGMLANETLGLQTPRNLVRDHLSAGDRHNIENLPNVRIAMTLAGIGRSLDADEVLRYEASLSGVEHYDALVHLASDLSLPRTQLWLAQRSPTGVKARAYMRYPMPNWTPAGGWRVDKALVFAHTLQESRFQTDVVSPAGARGLMQLLPSTATLLANATGEPFTATDLRNPSINMEYGQRYLEKLGNMSATDGLLAKVVAAYNAGPGAVEKWKYQVQDNGDPLLFIESVPYYETRAYVNTVLRNYWMYQLEDGGQSPALTALAQGLWSRFPSKRGETAVRISAAGRSFSAD
jgi:soluble lytic murein transglycosylase-like protein